MKNTTNPTTALAGQNREEHTALPWRTGANHPCRIFTNQPSVSLREPVGSTCEREDEGTETPEQIANAAFIVRAVNSHEALVSALDELCQAFAHNIPHASQRPTYLRARAALALAGKGAK